MRSLSQEKDRFTLTIGQQAVQVFYITFTIRLVQIVRVPQLEVTGHSHLL